MVYAAHNAICSITDEEFARFKRLIYELAGIALNDSKKPMVAGRLQKRLVHYGMTRYSDYFHFLHGEQNLEERQILIDLLTTNETYFFREPQHFDFLRDNVLPKISDEPARIWSAACSSGEEVYTLAMVLADFGRIKEWEIVGSDVSQRMLKRAASGLYTFERSEGISESMMKRFCLKGVRSQEGRFLIDSRLRDRCSFQHINLTESLPQLGRFDVIFLRNVMIYFDHDTKTQVVQRVSSLLKPGGHFFISHTESLHGIYSGLKLVKPSIFLKMQDCPYAGSTRRPQEENHH